MKKCIRYKDKAKYCQLPSGGWMACTCDGNTDNCTMTLAMLDKSVSSK